MEIVYNVWLAFNIVFSVWSSQNWIKWIYAKGANLNFRQSQLGSILDMIVLVSVLSFVFTFHK